MDKRVVIITSNLTNDFMSPREKFLKANVNVGMKEIHCLMGEGDNYSYDPPESLYWRGFPGLFKKVRYDLRICQPCQ